MYPSGRTCTSTPPSICTVITGKASRSADVNVMQKWLSLQVLYGWGGGRWGGQSAHRYVESEQAVGVHPGDGDEDDGDKDFDDDIPAYGHSPEVYTMASCDSLNTSRRFALGASRQCLPGR